jgi:phage baseplate assembly protein V
MADDLVERRDLYRRVENIAFYGVVKEADYKSARLRVQFGDGTTAMIPWTVGRAHSDSVWSAPEVGEQVMVISPSGDPSQGTIIGSLYQGKYPAKGDSAEVTAIHFADGSSVQYDRKSHKLSIATAQDGGLDISITGTGTQNYTSDLSISSDGSVLIRGKSITVQAEDISLEATSIKTNVPIRLSP